MDPMGHPIARPRKTIEDFLALGEEVLAELIDGELYMNASPRPRHQRIALRLARALSEFVEDCGLGEVFVAPLDVYLPTEDVVEPDLVFVASDQAQLVKEDAVHGTPRLLVEVLSPSNPERDRVLKFARYAQSGVAEYWIVDPELRGVELFVLEQRQLVPAGWFTPGTTFASPSFPGLDLDLAWVFGEPGDGQGRSGAST